MVILAYYLPFLAAALALLLDRVAFEIEAVVKMGS